MSEEKKTTPHRFNTCGAKKKNGEICQHIAGFGTNHKGTGRCKYHGGASTGATSKEGRQKLREINKKNTKSVKTGEHQTVWLDCLTDKEKELYEKAPISKKETLEQELRLTWIRLWRMLNRIKELSKKDLTLVKETIEVSDEGGTKKEYQATLGQIQVIEDGITRVLTQRNKTIDQLIKYDNEIQEDEKNSLSLFMEELKTIRAKSQ